MATINHTVRVPLNGTTFTVDVRPVYTREFYLRMWLGMRLIMLAGWILGCGIEFEGIKETYDTDGDEA